MITRSFLVRAKVSISDDDDSKKKISQIAVRLFLKTITNVGAKLSRGRFESKNFLLSLFLDDALSLA